ncbi:DNA mismatch repair protein MutS, core [Kalmanozyma brasiliensis GHG001]|uniref:DNA mismatch repair protein MutS, core n=1 Tax=Kalmanozyma brasiliensis (strain GHG001) TaxID=1365824 RepID=UPI002867F7B5|nr:DNA mismatch repair protein MutS, core [Kalmanozyma brasiliensis GHG001]EST07013.2 DNA mismatch repair protein MutS, core [Kalmanozyma brasiliensis GHG001]
MSLNDASTKRGGANRPDTAASVATSSSDFRIPGLRPSAQQQGGISRNVSQSPSPAPSFLRIFAPQHESAGATWYDGRTGRDSPVAWLAKHGPSPRELLDSSQGPIEHRQPFTSSVQRTLGVRNWDAAHTAPASAPPTSLPSGDHVRPFTASSYHRSRLVTADGFVGSYVCALLENRGVGREVGIASIERETGLCVITQLADTPTYVRTVQHMSMYPPSILLVPASGSSRSGKHGSFTSTTRSKRAKTHDGNDGETNGDRSEEQLQRGQQSVLISTLEQIYGIQAQPFNRKHWNYQEGARYLDRLLIDDADEIKAEEELAGPLSAKEKAPSSQQSQRPASSRPQTGRYSLDLHAKASTRAAILVAVADKFYLLSALAGLLDFYTESFNRVFTPKTLRIRFVVPEGTTLINSNTVHDLELVRNLIDPRSNDSLFGLLDHCVTPMGKRLLKMNLLQPLTDPDALSVRQDAVAECVNSEERYIAIRESLKPIREKGIDLDKLIHSLSCPQRGEPPKEVTERKVSSILALRTLLLSLGPARAALHNSSSQLLQSISDFFESSEIDEISRAIQATIDEDVQHAKNGLKARNARMYAVRAERSPLIDVARQTYRENLSDIESHRQQLESDTNLSLSLKMLQTNLDSSQIPHLPDYFTNITKAKGGKQVTMMTLALKKLNARLNDSMTEVLVMTDTIVNELIDNIVERLASLNNISEALGLLDMIFSFATVSMVNDYVRPVFGDRLDIRTARHPILDRVEVGKSSTSSFISRRRGTFVPNDIFLAPGERICLVTGPNMSGKSTLLRQIALITVLAGIGCFVPATRATLPLPDALLSLLTHEDDATQNLSTFAAEMRTAAFILSVGSPNSLVLLDEMGRGTSPDEGCALATAVIEELLTEKGSTTFFATHFGELVDGLRTKEGIVCQHLNVSMVQKSENVDLVFHHKLHLGPGLNTHYSLQVAKMMGCFPDDFLQRAQNVAVAEQLINAERTALIDNEASDRRKILRQVVRELRHLVEGSSVEVIDNEDEEPEKQPAKKLIEKLSLLQLHAIDEVHRTYPDRL